MQKLLEQTGTLLYRGTGLTEQELKTYEAKIGKEFDYDDPNTHVTLTGFTSTSMDKSQAQNFAWSN